MTSIRCYSELIQFETFEERFEYLNLQGKVGGITFGDQRYLNQLLYRTDTWKTIRRKIIVRDLGCDLGILDREIGCRITVHHMNPITVDDVLSMNPKVFDPEYLICSADLTHKAIHYGDISLLATDPIIRNKNDTCPWRH